MSVVSQPHFCHKVLTLDTPVLLFLEFFKKINVTNGKGLLYGVTYFLDTLAFYSSSDCLHLVVVGGLRASMTLQAMQRELYVPGRTSQAGQAIRERPD